jgi:hypothetical protein
MKAHLHLFDASTGQWSPVVGSALGGIGGGSTGVGSAADSNVGGWFYAAASGGITNTSDVTLAAAPGAGMANYLTNLQIHNSDATVATEVVIKSGASTVLWRIFLPAGRPASLTPTMPTSFTFSRPLVADNNTALTVAAITTSAELYINAQGFIAQSPQSFAGATSGTVVEIFDALGNQLVTAGGNTIVQGI